MTPRHGLLLTFILASLIATPAATALAERGSYDVSACNDAPEAANNSWVWSTNDPSQPSHYTEHTNCPYPLGGNGGRTDQESGLSTTDALGLSNGAPPNTNAGWTFTAPTDTTITAITYERYIGHILDSSNYWSPALRVDGTIIPEESCLDTIGNGESCSIGGPPGHGGEPGTITDLSAHQLELSITCQAPSGEECVTGATEHKTWATMYGAKVTISDPTPPTLNTPTGTLWEPNQTGFHKGTQNVTVTANDTGGGIQKIELTADGKPIETYNAPCDFTYPKPCPNQTGPQTLTLPTTQLPDGTHTITLTTTDAADNQTTISQQITTANNPPPPPTELTATPTQPGSSTFIVTWTNPPAQIAPITTATYQICPASNPGACSTPTTISAQGPLTVTTPGPGNWTLSVWLTNIAGNSNPTNAARTTLTVPTPNSTPSATPNPGTPNYTSTPSNTSLASKKPTASKIILHVTVTLHARKLIIHVSGPPTGTVHINYTGRYHHRTIISGKRTATLKNGRLTTTFRLNARAAASAMILVSVRLGRSTVTDSTLRRT